MCFALASPTFAQVDPLSGIDFVTIGAVNNPAWAGNGDPDDQAVGRGSVGYEYKIGRYEVTTAQWAEFLSAAYDRPPSKWIPHLDTFFIWGGMGVQPTVPGGLRFAAAPGQEMRFVGGLSWRMAAIYCNWLHNDKSLDRNAFLSGVYDVSTFGPGQSGGFGDQLTRSPGAKYFIPTWDEWLKASHYDPSKQNPDGTTGGWWLHANMRDTPLTYGPPPSFGGDGTGMANAGFDAPGVSEVTIPLGAYPTQLSPWGLLDTAGGTIEWLESALFGFNDPQARMIDGSYVGSSLGSARAADDLRIRGGEYPSFAFSDFGFRIAAAIPAPGVLVMALVGAVVGTRRRR